MITDQTIVAGADIDWEEDLADYPANEYDLTIYLKLGSAAAVTVTTTKSGATFVHSIPNTLLTAAGNYQFQYKFTDSDGKITYPATYTGVINVGASLATSGDLRSDDQKVYDELIAARLKVAQRDYVSLTINGKSTTFKDLTKLEYMIQLYAKRLGLIKPSRILASFE